MKARKAIGSLLVVLAVVFTIYLSLIMIRKINAVVLKKDYIDLFRYELIACVFFLLFSLDVRFGMFTKLKPVVLKVLGWILRILVILVTAVLLFFMVKVTAGCFVRNDAPAKNAIVLGMALENGEPTNDLLARLDTAEQFLRKNPDATLILTGGNADETGKTEAAVMHDILAERGVPEKQMLLEDRAEDTKENFRNTVAMINAGEPVALISSSYHMDRASQTARSAGFAEVLRIPAPASFLDFGANVMSEVILELNELTLKK